MNKPLANRDIDVPADWDRRGLPGWCYHSPALLELEKESLFRRHWQLACHVSDVPEPGDYITFDVCGERALVMRGTDNVVRAFHNICRHRGSRVAPAKKGHCKSAMVCPFHGWVYNLDGTLRGPARPQTFPALDKAEFGLKEMESEIWNGLVFIRFEKGSQPPVREILAPFALEMSHYRMDTMLPTTGVWSHRSPVNWKSVRDVDNEGYHVALAHPALQDLYGRTYYDEPYVDGVCRSFATFKPQGGRRWSVRHYTKMSTPPDHLPDELKTAWIYYGMFPNTVIAVSPEGMQFYQEFPLTTDSTRLRGAVYRFRDETREQKLARYLAFRIDRDTLAEDVQLTIWSNEAMAAKAFEGFFLSDLEYGVRTHHDHIRRNLPVCTLAEAPAEDEIAALNTKLGGA